MNCGGDATAHFNAGGGLAVDGLPTETKAYSADSGP